jgi:hypothetical protein
VPSAIVLIGKIWVGRIIGDSQEEFLQTYRGFLQVDAYMSPTSSFFTKPERGMIEMACMAHARPHIFQALDNDPSRGTVTCFGSDRGGKTAAVLRSFVTSCALVEVDPFRLVPRRPFAYRRLLHDPSRRTPASPMVPGQRLIFGFCPAGRSWSIGVHRVFTVPAPGA